MNPIGMMFALIAGVILLPALYMGVSNYADQVRATATALQMAHIQKAAEAYITTNAAAVEANSTASSPAVITVPMLVNTGFLPLGFNAMNPYGQTWEVQVLQPAANQLQALVLGIGGAAIPAKQSGMVATTAGDSGGVIGGGTGDFAVPGCAGGEACGAYAGWSVSTAGYQNVAAAHPAALIEYANNQLQSDYLYRVAVPGQPQLNTMQTNLNMGNNNINNAQNVNVNQDVTLGNPSAATGGYAASDAGQLGVDEPAGQGMPSGWGGGIHTWDMYANGTVAAGVNGSQGAYMNDFSGGYGGGGEVATASPNGANIAYMQSNNSGSSIATNGTVQGSYVKSTGIVAGANVQASNSVGAGSYFGTYGGTWWADNAGNSSQSGNAIVEGQVSAGNIYLSGNTGTNNPSGGSSGYLGFVNNANVSLGGACGAAIGEPATALAADAQGQILKCYGGTWQTLGGLGSGPYYYSLPTWNGSNTSEQIPGSWAYCAMASVGTTGQNDGQNFNDGVEEVSPGIWDMWGEAVTAACYQ